MKADVAAGVRWGMVNQLVQQVTRFGVQVVLTRLLLPEDFGLLALAFVVVNAGALLTGLGFSQALIQRKELDDHLVDAVFVGSGLIGLALAGLVALAAPLLASALGDPDVEPILRWLSVVFAFQGFEGVPNSLLRRQLMFRLYVLSSTVAAVVGGVVGITAGVAGAGVWALVAFALVEAVVATGLAWAFAIRAGVWRPRMTTDLGPLRHVLGYSGAVTGTRLLNYSSRNVDNVIVGRVLGTVALGQYGLAYRVMLFPLQRVAEIVSSVALPAFARIQSDAERLVTSYLRAVRLLAAVVVPITAGVALSAHHLVPAVFGPQWDGAITPLRLLALSGPALALVHLNGSVWEATGRARLSLWMSALGLGLLVPGFLIGVQFGVDGVALAFPITMYLGLAPSQFMLARTTGITLRRQLANVSRVLLAAAALALAALGADALVPDSAPDLVALLVMAIAGGAAYAAVLLTTDRHLAADAAALLRPQRAGAGS